jgi:hypothetical protein
VVSYRRIQDYLFEGIFFSRRIDICKYLYLRGKEEGAMLSPKQAKAYDDFYDSARHNDVLEPKTTLMLHMAAAMAVGCYP